MNVILFVSIKDFFKKTYNGGCRLVRATEILKERLSITFFCVCISFVQNAAESEVLLNIELFYESF